MVLNTRNELMESLSKVFPDVSKKKVNRICQILKPKGKNSEAWKADSLIRQCCEFLNVELSEIKGKGKKQELVDKRHMIMAAVSENLARCTDEKLGEKLNRDRTVIIYARQKVKNLCQTDENFRRMYEDLNNYVLK